MLATLILVASISEGSPSANERKPTSHEMSEDFRDDVKQKTDKIIRNNAWNKLPETPVPSKPQLDLTNSDATDVCFGSIDSWFPWDGDGAVDKLNHPSDHAWIWNCKNAASVAKAIGSPSFFLKGISYVCGHTPLPQAQVMAKAIDVTSYANSDIALVVSVKNCANKAETKFAALVKACESLRDMKTACQGVDDSPF